MIKSPRKNVPDVGIELGAACKPSGHASDRATRPADRGVKGINSIGTGNIIDLRATRETNIGKGLGNGLAKRLSVSGTENLIG